MFSYPNNLPPASRPVDPRAPFATFARLFALGSAQPFADCLPEDRFHAIAARHGVDGAAQPSVCAVYTPVITLFALITQCLSAAKSCVAAVARVMILRISLDLPPCSEATGAYCQARAKLPVAFLRDLTLEIADQARRQTPPQWLWKSRHVHFADGTTLSGPGTLANLAEYPQSSNQKEGLGFPLVRLLVLLCCATAMLQGAAIAPFKGKGNGETSLLGGLLDRLRSGDVLVADSYFCVFWLIAVPTGLPKYV